VKKPSANAEGFFLCSRSFPFTFFSLNQTKRR
jgi:hypothetical protein